jgi:hypothetical protein
MIVSLAFACARVVVVYIYSAQLKKQNTPSYIYKEARAILNELAHWVSIWPVYYKAPQCCCCCCIQVNRNQIITTAGGRRRRSPIISCSSGYKRPFTCKRTIKVRSLNPLERSPATFTFALPSIY